MQHAPVVGQQYVAQTVRSYAVSKKKISVSKGDWTITDQMGHSSFKVDGRVASMRDRRFLRDAAGNKILTMKKKVILNPKRSTARPSRLIDHGLLIRPDCACS